MKNYICINGKKAALTEEQMRQLGLKIEPTILWIITKEDGVRTRYTCPHCNKYFISLTELDNRIFASHRYCGCCGVQNVFGGV